MRTEKLTVQGNLFDFIDRAQAVAAMDRPLNRLDRVMDWEGFRPALVERLNMANSAKGGRPAKDPVLMFKLCVLQYYHGLSDEETEFQVSDRHSFQRFLGLSVSDRVPDARTLWLFKERLGEEGVRELFALFSAKLEEAGLVGKEGTLVDASFVSAPVQRNSREENALIKEGKRPARFDENPRVGRQKDTDARWTKKNGVSHYGYKNHASVDATSKLILCHETTPAHVHDSQVIEELVREAEAPLFADSAYRSEEIEEMLKSKGVRSHIHQKAHRHRPLSPLEQQLNQVKSRVRVRVEHVFAWQGQRRMDQLRTIGLARAKRCVSFFNLVYNIFRYEFLTRNTAPA